MKIGIFWLYKEAIIGRPVSLDVGEESLPGIIDSPDNHADLWEEAPGVLRPYPELRRLEYFSIPRGRVLWDMEKEMALVYMDKVLFREEIKGKISRFFDLGGCAIDWKTDVHYTTNLTELEGLFAEDV